MDVELYNVRALVTAATDAEHEWLTEYLSWPDDKAWVMKRRGYRTPSYIRLYNRVDDSYPAGFTRMIAEAAKKAGIAFNVQDGRPRPVNAPLPLPGYLRDYQDDACKAAIKRTRGVIWAATGAGKTQIATALIESLPCRWLFLVNQTQLGMQARDRYKVFAGQDSGVIAEGVWDPNMHPHGLTVATFQMLHARLKKKPDPMSGLREHPDKQDALDFLRKVEGVIVDECHVLPADSFRAVLDYLPNAYYRLGLSATPLQRGDRKSMHLIGCLGSVAYRISAKTLIDAGVLAKPIIKLLPCDQVSEKKTWQGAYNELVVKSAIRNRLVCDMAQKAAKPCLVFVQALEQGERITKTLAKRGVQVEYIDGSAPTPVRQAAVTRLERGDTDVIVATVVMNQGIDIPQLRSVVMGAGGASSIMALQRVGRGMRVVPGKTEFEVWDVDDRGNKWTERHTKERIRSYEVEDYEVEVIDPLLAWPVSQHQM